MSDNTLEQLKEKCRTYVKYIVSGLLLLWALDSLNYFGYTPEQDGQQRSWEIEETEKQIEEDPTHIASEICKNWQAKYPTISYDEFPNDTLSVRNETWVIELDTSETKEWSGVVSFQYFYDLEAAGATELQLSNGVVIEDNPQKQINLRNKQFRFRSLNGTPCYKLN